MHKNNLQEFTQSSKIALPVYRTVNEGGCQNAPEVRSTVWVDGMSYTLELTFSRRKAAEQEAARVALECLAYKIEGHSLICEVASFCKSILNEYAAKLNLQRPSYNTLQLKGLVPSFRSSLVFNGTEYTGDATANKKDAEQFAARAAILSMLGKPDSGTMLIQIIRSKSELYDAIKRKGFQPIHAGGVSQ